MHTICKQYGKVRKIVVFRKSVLQSMVEFEDIAASSAAMRELNGADIYSGCCTLKAEYAKVSPRSGLYKGPCIFIRGSVLPSLTRFLLRGNGVKMAEIAKI